MAIRRTTKTNRKRIIYQNQAVFSAETGASAPTDINQIHRVQEASHSVEIERVSVNEFGSLSLGQREIIESPTVNLDFSYYVVDGKNEAHTLGLDVMGINTDVEKHAISSIMKGQGEDSRNYYIMITPPDKDASQELDYSEDDYDNMGVIGIGNAYITNYSFNAAIGEIPTANVSAQASNVRFDISGSGFQNPAIDTKDGSLVDQTVQLPKSTTGNLLQYVVRPGDLTLSFDTETLDQGGAVLPGTNNTQSTVAVQSINFELPLSRTPIQEVGSSFPKVRQLDFPITATVTVNALLADITSGDLSSLICQDTQKREISVRLGSRCKGFTLMVASLKNATLDSQSMSSSIGDNKSVDLTFSAQIGGPEDLDNGLFFNSEILPVTFSPLEAELFLSTEAFNAFSVIESFINPEPTTTTTITPGPTTTVAPCNQAYQLCVTSNDSPQTFNNTRFVKDPEYIIDSWDSEPTDNGYNGTLPDQEYRVLYTGNEDGTTWFLFAEGQYSGKFLGTDPYRWVFHSGVGKNIADHTPVYIAKDLPDNSFSNDDGYFCIEDFDLDNKIFEKIVDGTLTTITTGNTCFMEPPTTTTTTEAPPTRPDFLCFDQPREMNYNFGQFGPTNEIDSAFLGGWNVFEPAKDNHPSLFLNTMYVFTNTGELAAKVYYTEPIIRERVPNSGLGASLSLQTRFNGEQQQMIDQAEEAEDYHEDITFRRKSIETFPIHDKYGCQVPNQSSNWGDRICDPTSQYDCIATKTSNNINVGSIANDAYYYRWPTIRASLCQGGDANGFNYISGDTDGFHVTLSQGYRNNLPELAVYNGKRADGKCYIGGVYEISTKNFGGTKSLFHYEDTSIFIDGRNETYKTYETGNIFNKVIQGEFTHNNPSPDNQDLIDLVNLAKQNIENYIDGEGILKNSLYSTREHLFQGWNFLSYEGLGWDHQRWDYMTGENTIGNQCWIVFGKTELGDLPQWVKDDQYACTYFNNGQWGAYPDPTYVQ